MKYKHIEMMREARLWTGQIFVPLIIGGMTLMSIPEVRNNIFEQGAKAKNAVSTFVSNITKR
jgi:hypothetical protein